jgi:hypothetical protein
VEETQPGDSSFRGVDIEELDRASLSLGEGEVEEELPRSIDRNEVEDMEEQSLEDAPLRREMVFEVDLLSGPRARGERLIDEVADSVGAEEEGSRDELVALRPSVEELLDEESA